jgi:hypothetical protein
MPFRLTGAKCPQSQASTDGDLRSPQKKKGACCPSWSARHRFLFLEQQDLALVDLAAGRSAINSAPTATRQAAR